MGVIVLEGVVITILVLIGLREAIMAAVPLALKRSIGVGIGLFILFIGLVDGGLIVTPQGGSPIVGLSFPTEPAQFVFLLGLLITFALFVLKIRAALIISILVDHGRSPLIDRRHDGFPSNGLDRHAVVLDPRPASISRDVFTKLGADHRDPDDLRDHAERLLRHDGHGHRRRRRSRPRDEDGSVPGIGRVLLVDSLAAVAGGAAGISSNTTYIESAAGVAEGGRTGFASVVTGVLFLLAIFFSPLAGIVPSSGHGSGPGPRRLPDVHAHQGHQRRRCRGGLPALLTMILMPLTYDITVGIGAGFVRWVLIKISSGKVGEIHSLMWVVTHRVPRLLRQGLDPGASSSSLPGARNAPAGARTERRPPSCPLPART